MSKILRESVLLGDQEITIETGRVAKQAGGSVLIQAGDTIVLVTACSGPTKPDISFFPLTCEYIEKAYAAGKIPGGYIKREGRLSERETLASRLIDRPIRPLFPDAYRAETQVIATVLSMDQENDPDVLAMTGASAARFIDGRKSLRSDPPAAIARVARRRRRAPAPTAVAIFTRGETQAINMVTLGQPTMDEQTIDRLVKKQRALHAPLQLPQLQHRRVKPHPRPRPPRSRPRQPRPARARPMMPGCRAFPYTIRLNCDILESNGSRSMATVCSGTLALMDAGVPIKAPVSGIAMGLISDGKRHAILSDILGDEDHWATWTSRSAGTAKGITATSRWT
jgi:polyribonucleotide nucleotidyltransferase